MPSAELILLVNDIPDHLATYETALERHGFRVQIARTGEQALEAPDRIEDETPETPPTEPPPVPVSEPPPPPDDARGPFVVS